MGAADLLSIDANALLDWAFTLMNVQPGCIAVLWLAGEDDTGGCSQEPDAHQGRLLIQCACEGFEAGCGHWR